MPTNTLEHDTLRFYRLLDNASSDKNSIRQLSNCSGKNKWPNRGLYIFLGKSENVLGNKFPRVTRIGTHAVSNGSKTTLWKRLAQHRGNAIDGCGNHRGSIFRLLVGEAIIRRDNLCISTWGIGNNAEKSIKESEKPLEAIVSGEIGNMPFLWLEIEDEPSPNSMRSRIERNSIALISKFNMEYGWGDENWLGIYSNRERVRNSGLWNNNYVGDEYDPTFLDDLERLIGEMR